MSAELDALIIRSLPELNDAATRLDVLSQDVLREIDIEIEAWIARNDWKGESEFYSDDRRTWLAPASWMVPNDPNDNTYLYFILDVTAADTESYWHVASLCGSGQQRIGFWLSYDVVKKPTFNRLWRELKNTAGLPLLDSEFFLPIILDRDALATAVESDAIGDALQPLRDALDRLPQLASQLEPLKREIVAASGAKNKTDPTA